MERFKIRTAPAFDQGLQLGVFFIDPPPGDGIGHINIRIPGAVAGKHQLLTVFGSVIGRLEVIAFAHDGLADHPGKILLAEHRVILFLQGVEPFLIKLLIGFADHVLEDIREFPVFPDVLHQQQDLVFAVILGDILHDCLAFLVHHVGAVDLEDVRQRNDIVVQHRILDHHLRLGVPFGRPIFRQPLHEP